MLDDQRLLLFHPLETQTQHLQSIE
jgi:hypothetical protein